MTLAFDVGGTAIKYGLVQETELRSLEEVPTHAKEGGGEGIVAKLCEIMDSLSGSFDRVAVSTAGQVDAASGTIIYANENIPRYTGTPLKKLLGDHCHLPVVVENDVNAAALGEAVCGAGVGWCQFICLTYGTGIGGALVHQGSIFHGMHGSAGEFGHFPLYPGGRLCVCGQKGCYEQYASTTALVRMVAKEHPQLTNGRLVMAHRQEASVARILDIWLGDVAKGIAALVNILDPGLVVLGGGIMSAPGIAEEVRSRVVPQVMDSLKDIAIVPARLGNTAGLLGSSSLFRSQAE